MDRRKILTVALVALALVPAVVLGVEVARCAVNVPYWDEWDIAVVLLKARHGTLAFTDLWAQHNESRKVFPRLVIVALGRLARGDVRCQMALSVLLASVVSLSLFVLVRRTLRVGANGRILAWAVLNVPIFGLIQHENWLWGIQFITFVPIACLALGMVAATSRWRLERRFLVAMALATVSSFSFANGMVCWPLLLPVLVAYGAADDPRSRRRLGTWCVVYAIAFVATAAAYFHGFTKPTYHPDPGAALRDPVGAATYALAFLGRAFAPPPLPRLRGAVVVGASLVLLLVGACASITLERSSSVGRRALPWLTLAGYALVSALVTTAGRFGFGVGQALASRYTTFSSYLAIGLIGLLVIANEPSLRRAAAPLRSGVWRVVCLMCVASLVAGSLAMSRASRKEMTATRRSRLEASAVLQWSGLLVSPGTVESRLHPDRALVLTRAKRLDRLGYLSTHRLDDPHLDVLEGTDEPLAGCVEALTDEADGSISLAGWARLGPRLDVADAILVSHDDDHGRPVAFALTVDRVVRRDVARTFQLATYRLSGFRAPIPPEMLAGVRRDSIRAWAFDAAATRVYPLARLGSGGCASPAPAGQPRRHRAL